MLFMDYLGVNDEWKVTRDHDEIRTWAKKYSAVPEIVNDPRAKADDPILRLNFPGGEDDVFLPESADEVDQSWDSFFERFDGLKYSFEHKPEYEGENPDLAYRFVRESEDEK
jgi:hypothetical protein